MLFGGTGMKLTSSLEACMPASLLCIPLSLVDLTSFQCGSVLAPWLEDKDDLCQALAAISHVDLLSTVAGVPSSPLGSFVFHDNFCSARILSGRHSPTFCFLYNVLKIWVLWP